MKIAITGGSGFIGQHLLRLANEYGHEAWSFDRNEGNDIMGDLRGLSGANCVVHLAGVLGTHELFDRVQDAIDINITGSHKIMRWCLNSGASYVGITMPDAFPSIYTATKIATQRLATALHHSRDLKVSHVRAFNAYGPWQKFGSGHPQKIIPTFSRRAWDRLPIPIWGDGSQTVDLIHAHDIAKILLFATELHEDQVIDAGTGVGITVNDLASWILKYTGSEAGVEYLPMRDGETPTEIVAKGENWWKLGDWRPRLDWNLITETVDWYRNR